MSIPRNNQSEKMHDSASTLKEKERMSKGKIGKGLLTRQLTDHSMKMSMQRSARPAKTSYRWHLRALAKALANRPLAGPKGSTRDVTCARYPPFLRRSQEPPAKFSACVYVDRCACACVRMCIYVCVAKAKVIGIVKSIGAIAASHYSAGRWRRPVELPCELTCSLLSRWPVTDTLDPPRALAQPMLRIPGGRSRAGPRTRTRVLAPRPPRPPHDGPFLPSSSAVSLGIFFHFSMLDNGRSPASSSPAQTFLRALRPIF